jgi:hypothetical protein
MYTNGNSIAGQSYAKVETVGVQLGLEQLKYVEIVLPTKTAQ